MERDRSEHVRRAAIRTLLNGDDAGIVRMTDELHGAASQIMSPADAQQVARDVSSFGSAYGVVMESLMRRHVQNFEMARANECCSDLLLATEALERVVSVLNGTFPPGVTPESATEVPHNGTERALYTHLCRELELKDEVASSAPELQPIQDRIEADRESRPDRYVDTAREPASERTETFVRELGELAEWNVLRIAAMEMFCIGFASGCGFAGLKHSKNNVDALVFRKQRAKRIAALRDANLEELQRTIAGVKSIWEAQVGKCISLNQTDMETASYLSRNQESLQLPRGAATVYKYRLAGWDAATYQSNESKRKGGGPKISKQKRCRTAKR